MANYMGLRLKHMDATDCGGTSYLVHVNHAAQAIAMGKISIALITLSGRPRSEGSSGTVVRSRGTGVPDEPYEIPYGPVTVNMYAMCAMRHMHEFGTTSEQLAWVKVAASHHAQHNPNAVLQEICRAWVRDVIPPGPHATEKSLCSLAVVCGRSRTAGPGIWVDSVYCPVESAAAAVISLKTEPGG